MNRLKENPFLYSKSLNPHCLARVFLFPHSGASCNVFDNCDMPEHIETISIQLPGRGPRFSEPLLDDMVKCASQIVHSIKPLLSRPFAFYGISLGALLAYETVRQLHQSNSLLPIHFFVSSHNPPWFPYSSSFNFHNLPRKDKITQIKLINCTPAIVLNSPEMMDLVLPILTNDWKTIETYDSQNPDIAAFTNIPITVFHGENDTHPRVSKEGLEAWRQLTKDPTFFNYISCPHLNHLMKTGREINSEHSLTIYEKISAIIQSNIDKKAKSGYVRSQEDITIFDQIVQKKAPANILFEDEWCMAIKDKYPIAPVHILILPKKKISKLSDASQDDCLLLGKLLLAANRVASLLHLNNEYRIIINNGSSALQTIFYLHIHLIGKSVMHWPPD